MKATSTPAGVPASNQLGEAGIPAGMLFFDFVTFRWWLLCSNHRLMAFIPTGIIFMLILSGSWITYVAVLFMVNNS